MKKRRHHLAMVVGLVIALGLIALALVVPNAGAQASVLSPGASGLLAARRYLDRRGGRTLLLDAPVDQKDSMHGVLVTAFPWQRADWRRTAGDWERHLTNGGILLLGYSGQAPSPVERRFFESLGFKWIEPRGRPPLHPLRWREFIAAEWSLTQDAAPGIDAGVVVRAPLFVPKAHESSYVWCRGENDLPMIFEERRGRGRLVVLPVEALSNARLKNEGNADLLETLAANLGNDWIFDEYHHGMTARTTAAHRVPRTAFDLVLAHIALLYLLTAIAIGRRFGPAWQEPPVRAGSTTAFLMGVGYLHDRFRHHNDAARLMLARAEELQPGLEVAASWRDRAEQADASELLRLSEDVARAQRRKGIK